MVQTIGSMKYAHPTRVALDGIDAASKTMLADEIADVLEYEQRCAIRASIDGFHRPKKDRCRRGELSPEGYYYDSFDYVAIEKYLLIPLGPGGTGEYRTMVFDFRTDSPLLSPMLRAPRDAILLFDGVFLMRPELNGFRDIRIFVHIDFDTSLRRALTRDQVLLGSDGMIAECYEKRYIPRQMIYLQQVKPEGIAQIVIDNNDLHNPILIRKSVKL
jgi:uridine kinase